MPGIAHQFPFRHLVQRSARWLVLAFCLCLSLISPASAQKQFKVLLLTGGNSPAYDELVSGVAKTVGTPSGEITVFKMDISALSREKLRDLLDADLLVTIGSRATLQLARAGITTPTIAALIPESSYESIVTEFNLKTGNSTITAVYLDQPLQRQLRLAQLALPHNRRAGILLGPTSSAQLQSIAAAAKGTGLQITGYPVQDEKDMPRKLAELIVKNDLLMAVPDPVVFNPKNAQFLFLTTYRAKVPVLGFSEAYVRAGALAAVYSTPEEIGMQVGEIITIRARHVTAPLPRPQYPKYFSVAVNIQVARSLGLDIPPAATLQSLLNEGAEP